MKRPAMRAPERTSPLALIATAAMGAAIGLLVQLFLSNRGSSPLIPPFTLPASLGIIGVVLLVLGLQLRRSVRTQRGNVNPFHAVRLLAAARAGQLVGSFALGFSGGLLLSLAGRSVPAPITTWSPMLAALISGIVLLGCAIATERLCRVPPGDDDAEGGSDAPESGPVDQAAYRKP